MIRISSIFLLVMVFSPAGSSQQPPIPAPMQRAPATAPANQANPALAPISSPEIDALAADVAPLIAKQHLSTVTVFGAVGPMDRITPMGLPIGDAFSEALAKRAQGFQVIDRSVLRTTLKQQQVAERMLSSDILADWISSIEKADGIVIVKLENFSPPDVTIAAYLYDSRKKESRSFANRKVVVQLDPRQAEAIKTTIETPIKREPDVSPGVTVAGKNGVGYPKCEYCPRPDYTQEAREAKQQGGIFLQVTVTEEGRATEIEITQALGYGLDAQAVKVIQTWRFKPATDSNGNPVSVVTFVQVQFQLFSMPQAGSNPPATLPQIPRGYPVCIYGPHPDYSEEAKKKKIQGDVWLEAFVTVEGKVGDIRVTKSLGYGLDEEAINAVKGWKFKPAVGPDGKPISTWTSIQVQFKLR